MSDNSNSNYNAETIEVLTMTYETIQFEQADGVARITLNRPERLNALCEATFPELHDALDRARDLLSPSGHQRDRSRRGAASSSARRRT